jgi:hypothetical protein
MLSELCFQCRSACTWLSYNTNDDLDARLNCLPCCWSHVYTETWNARGPGSLSQQVLKSCSTKGADHKWSKTQMHGLALALSAAAAAYCAVCDSLIGLFGCALRCLRPITGVTPRLVDVFTAELMGWCCELEQCLSSALRLQSVNVRLTQHTAAVVSSVTQHLQLQISSAGPHAPGWCCTLYYCWKSCGTKGADHMWPNNTVQMHGLAMAVLFASGHDVGSWCGNSFCLRLLIGMYAIQRGLLAMIT